MDEDEILIDVILDRTYLRDGVRWVVDYKTGALPKQDPDTAIHAEVGRYRDQLARYARLMARLDPGHPVRCAIYFTSMPRLVTLDAIGADG